MITERIDKITLIPETHLKTVLPAPRSVKIELTGRCNYRCSFCALSTRDFQPEKDMDLEFFKRITLDMRDSGVEEFGVFFIGESFLSPKLLVDCVRYLKKDLLAPYVFLTSNGSAANPQTVEALMVNGLDSLKWSVNTADDQQFVDIVRKGPQLRHKALKNIRSAWEIREKGQYSTKLYASSILYDGEQQTKMEKSLADVLPYVDQHYWLPLYSMGSFATKREEELGYRPIAGNQGRIGALRDPLPCWSVFTEGHVTSTGKLSACCFDANGSWIMADLQKVKFMDAWNSVDFQELRYRHLNKDVAHSLCEHCIAYS